MRRPKQSLLTWEHGSRQQSRLTIHLPAILTTRDGTRRVMLKDLSTRGARFTSADELSVGQEVVIQWLRFEAFGEIQWNSDGVYGVAFARSIMLSSLVETRDSNALGIMQPIEREIVSRTALAFVEGRLRL